MKRISNLITKTRNVRQNKIIMTQECEIYDVKYLL